MGAWGTGVFDNDTACDWSYDLEKTKDFSLGFVNYYSKKFCNKSNLIIIKG